MATATTRIGLIKPAGGEPINVDDLNTNSDRLDKVMPFVLVNDGVTPPDTDLIDGSVIMEKTSGLVWVAQKSGASFIRKPIINQVGQSDGVTPPDNALYDGALVREKTSGLIWMAVKSGSSFVKRLVSAPTQYAGPVGINGTATVAGITVFSLNHAAVTYDRVLQITVCFTANSFSTATQVSVTVDVNGTTRMIPRCKTVGQATMMQFQMTIAAGVAVTIVGTATVDNGNSVIANDTRFNYMNYQYLPVFGTLL